MKTPSNFIGYDKALSDALVSARGQKVLTNQDRIEALERKLEVSKLSNAEIADIQRQLKQLRNLK